LQQLELETWSIVPRGSGLGTSSILAAGIAQAVSRALLHTELSTQRLVELVVRVEQTLTSGGGWQDQAGGLADGIKLVQSAARLPLQVSVKTLLSAAQCSSTAQLGNHMLLLYSGSSRLARDLLRSTLRRWYRRDERMMRTVAALRQNVHKMHEALMVSSTKTHDLARIGALLSAYNAQKWDMVGRTAMPPYEPRNVGIVMRALAPLLHGWSFCGAGGGGFMLLVTKHATSAASTKARIQGVIDDVAAAAASDFQLFDCAVSAGQALIQ
jgi:fucokinase